MTELIKSIIIISGKKIRKKLDKFDFTLNAPAETDNGMACPTDCAEFTYLINFIFFSYYF